MKSTPLLPFTILLFAAAVSATATPRWNILHIVSDNLRDALACYGEFRGQLDRMKQLLAAGWQVARPTSR